MYFMLNQFGDWIPDCRTQYLESGDLDFSEFVQLELRPVAEIKDRTTGAVIECCQLQPDQAANADLWSIYARRKDGLVEVIADDDKELSIRKLAEHLAETSGLPLS